MESEANDSSCFDDASRRPDASLEEETTCEEVKDHGGGDRIISERAASIDSLLVDCRSCSIAEYLDEEDEESETDFHLTGIKVHIINLPGEYPRDVVLDTEDHTSLWSSSVCDSLCVERRRRARERNSPIVDEHD